MALITDFGVTELDNSQFGITTKLHNLMHMLEKQTRRPWRIRSSRNYTGLFGLRSIYVYDLYRYSNSQGKYELCVYSQPEAVIEIFIHGVITGLEIC